MYPRLFKSVCTALLTAGLVTPVLANTASINTSTGQGLEVTITLPDSQLLLDGTPINIDVSAVLGTPPPVPVNIVYVADLSVSMQQVSPGTIGDCNGDGAFNTRQDAECRGLVALNRALGSAGNVNIGLVGFSSNAVNADMDPADGIQLFTSPPDADKNADGVADVEEVITTLRNNSSPGSDFAIGKFTPVDKTLIGTSTNFQDALAKMQDAFNSRPPGEENIAAFISDGEQTLGDYMLVLPDVVAAGTKVHTFAVGPLATNECQLDKPLGIIASDTGGSCTVVSNASTLESVLPDVLTTRIEAVEVYINGTLVASNTGSDPANLSLSNLDISAYLVDGTNELVATVRTADGTSISASITVQTTSVPPPAPPAGETGDDETSEPDSEHDSHRHHKKHRYDEDRHHGERHHSRKEKREHHWWERKQKERQHRKSRRDSWEKDKSRSCKKS